jgi:simple sugar transport system ATP-binding protein
VTGERPVAVAAAHGVCKRFGRTQALDDVTLEIRPGTIQGLVGRNGSGKSTLVSLLTGLQPPDAGAIHLDGRPAPAISERQHWRRVVACVYQHSSLIPDLTVAENISLGGPRTSRFVSWRSVAVTAAEVLSEWELGIEPDTVVSDLSANEQQLIEIARATHAGTKFLVLDEPTTRLSQPEVAKLLAVVRQVRSRGGSVLFISHYLQESFEVCDTITVLRDGKVVAEMDPGDVEEADVVAAMVGGRRPDSPQASVLAGSTAKPASEPRLRVADLGVGQVRGLTFEIRPGECVGLAGTTSSGNRLVADCLAGLVRETAGQVLLDGAPLPRGSVKDLIAAGVGFVPADRGYNGLVPVLTIEDNITMSVARRIKKAGFIRPSTRRRLAEQLIADVGVAGGDATTQVSDLSGGNQQKVVVGRALASEPRLLILVEPTSGVDIASRETIVSRIRKALAAGTAVLVVSERPEELALCTRVFVMFQGQVISELGRDRTEHELVGAIEGVGA